jgi:hypothetical protein
MAKKMAQQLETRTVVEVPGQQKLVPEEKLLSVYWDMTTQKLCPYQL